MMYAVLFEDDLSRADMRPKYMPEHLAFLERNASAIHAAGPLKDTESDAPAGGLWIVQAEGPQTVRLLIEADPFWPTGLRKSIRVLEWTQVFADGKRQI
ncbi:MAG: YciI family protein [Gammaproteobacteria bacterium]|nr:YciI family protein [Gammaproteobacteria bacterium]